MNTVRALELQPGMEDWGRSLREMLTIVESLSVLELDRVMADFVNTLIARRNLWLRALSPPLPAQLTHDLRGAPFLTQGLFGDLPLHIVEQERSRRKDDGVLALISKIKPQASAPAPKQERNDKAPFPQAAKKQQQQSKPARGDRSRGKGKQQQPSHPPPPAQQSTQQQQWRGRGAKAASAPTSGQQPSKGRGRGKPQEK